MGGSVGAIWRAANGMPHETVAIFNHVQERNYAEAMALWQKILPSLLLLWKENYVGRA